MHDDTSPTRIISWNASPNMNVASSVITRDVWQKWELILGANTPGQYDGEAHWWLNGVKVGQFTNVGYCDATQTGAANTWQVVDWNPTYGGGTTTIPTDQFMYMDHVYISGK